MKLKKHTRSAAACLLALAMALALPFGVAAAGAGNAPFMLTQSIQGDAATTRTLQWFTAEDAATQVIVKDSRGRVVKNSIDMEKATPLKVGVPRVDFGKYGLLESKQTLVKHIVRVRGLRPGSRYTFQAGDAAKGFVKGEIKTANGGQNTTFLSFTDQQSTSEADYNRSFGRLNKLALQKYPATDFVVSVGDQTENGRNFNQWKWFMGAAGGMLASLPVMPATGNHEFFGGFVTQYFAPKDAPKQSTARGEYYSFDYNNVHVMVLNTNNASAWGLGKAQLNWLKADAAQSRAAWKIVALHKAPYSNGNHYKDSVVKGLRTQLSKLLPELGVDLVIQGHDHVYLRTGVIASNRIVETATKQVNGYEAYLNPKGTVYAIVGSAGVKYYTPRSAETTRPYFPAPAVVAPAKAPMFAAYRTQGNTLYYNAYRMDKAGELTLVDQFAIQKSVQS
jgi:hypothetical protein